MDIPFGELESMRSLLPPVVLSANTRARVSERACVCSLLNQEVKLRCTDLSLSHPLVSGEGLFVAEATGRGVLFVQAIGAIFQRQLRAGEEWIGTPLMISVVLSSMPN